MHSLQKAGIHQLEHICKHSISGFNDLLVRRPKTAIAVRAPLLQGDRDLGAAGYSVWGLTALRARVFGVSPRALRARVEFKM